MSRTIFRLRNYLNSQLDEWLDVSVVMILYDITFSGAFDNALGFLRILERRLPPACELCFVGTKCDLKVTITRHLYFDCYLWLITTLLRTLGRSPSVMLIP